MGLQGKFFSKQQSNIQRCTSNWAGIGFLVGSERTVVHFFLSWELTSTTRLSLVHLSQEGVVSLVRCQDKRHAGAHFCFKGLRDSRVSCFGRAILPVLVGLADLAVLLALAAHKHQLQVRRPKASPCVRQLQMKGLRKISLAVFFFKFVFNLIQKAKWKKNGI